MLNIRNLSGVQQLNLYLDFTKKVYCTISFEFLEGLLGQSLLFWVGASNSGVGAGNSGVGADLSKNNTDTDRDKKEKLKLKPAPVDHKIGLCQCQFKLTQ